MATSKTMKKHKVNKTAEILKAQAAYPNAPAKKTHKKAHQKP
jgi:hypothetical protein